MIKKLMNMALCGLLLFAAGCQEKPQTQEPDDKPAETVKPEDGKPMELENFTVTLTSLHAGDVFLNIEPKDKEQTYWFQLQVKEEMGETDEEIIASDIAYLNYMAEYYGTPLAQLLADNLLTGDIEWRYQYLEPNTEYVLYMYGMNINGEATTDPILGLSDAPNEAILEKNKNNHFSRKLKADVWIDDRNVGGLPDWGTIYEMIHNKLTYEDIMNQYHEGQEDSLPKKGFFARLFRK